MMHFVKLNLFVRPDEFKRRAEELKAQDEDIVLLPNDCEYICTAPPKGTWIKEPQTEDIYLYRCSACLREAGCGGWHHMWFNYCPNCGAKMEVEHETD